MLAVAASASRHLLQRDASIGACSGSGNRVCSLLTVSAITTYPIRCISRYSYGYGISLNNPQHRTCPSLLFAIKGFLSDSSSSNFPRGRVPRPYLPPFSPTVDGRALFSTSTKINEGSQSQSQKDASSTIAKPPAPPSGQVADVKILRTLASYLWMKDNFEFRVRVVVALSLLVGAKVLNVQVPFLFKLAVDWLTAATGSAGVLASSSSGLALFATPVAVLIGYGIARAGASAFNELRTAVFSKVALRTIRLVSRKEEVYMEIPPGYDTTNGENKTGKLDCKTTGAAIKQNHKIESNEESPKAAMGRGLLFKMDENLSMEVYIDVGLAMHYAGSIVDKRSTIGYCMFLGGNLVT
ncbi:ABC transporter B family member 25, partial [Mucuna pruriens]